MTTMGPKQLLLAFDELAGDESGQEMDSESNQASGSVEEECEAGRDFKEWETQFRKDDGKST